MAKPTSEADLTGFGYERLQHVGKGQYASAALVKETSSGTQFVAKCISLAALNDHDQELANQEVILLQTLAHPYIVAYRDSFLIEGSNTLVIVMEHCAGGDMRQSIKAKSKAAEQFQEDQIMTWFVQLCLALQYCHSEKVLHRDLKTSNIFLTDGATIKLGDFGISRVLEGTTEAAVTIVGTPYYMSPEVCRSEPYNWKSDIWALGCVLYELCMLKHAFESSSLLGLVYKIVSDHYEPIPSFYSQELNDLIRQLLMKSAESRPTINQLFAMPYVKAYLARVAPPTPQAPLPPLAEPTSSYPATRPRRGNTLRPKPPPPAAPPSGGAPPPPPPGPPPLAPQSGVLIIASRIRRRLVGQKLNWLSSFASFDSEGNGALSRDEMCNALQSMFLGIGEAEIAMLMDALCAPGTKISLDTFSTYLRDVPPEVLQYEAWTRQTLAAAASGRPVEELLRSKDMQQQGTLAPDVFMLAMRELVPTLTDPQLQLLVLLADKNALGDVDYIEFGSVFAPPPLAPPLQPGPPLPPAPKGMPPVNFGASGPLSPARPGQPAAPPGMPPVSSFTPGSPPAAAPAPAVAPQDLGMTLTMGDINAMTFFTCASRDGLIGSSSAARVSLSNDGCALIFSRIRRRLDAAGLAITDVLALFTQPGDADFTADQWLEVASSLPLGTSRAEMQQLFSKVDATDSGRIPAAQLASLIGSVSPAHCATTPPWILAAMRRGLGGQIRDELHKLGGCNGATLARESDFKRVVMQTERYLTSDQLSSLLLMADKNSLGLVDYQEFAERFAMPGAVLRVPGGVLPSATPAWSAGAAVPTSEEELRAVSSRTAAVMERQGFAPERLPALLALWGDASPPDVVARILALLPLGVSHLEASGMMQAVGGNLALLASSLAEHRNQGTWRGWCSWAEGNIPGPSLRAVLQRQVIEAECRTLDPAEFVRNLSDAGVKGPSTGPALWLAEKTEQGDILVAEFLNSFGGAAAEEQKKKKRGFFRWR